MTLRCVDKNKIEGFRISGFGILNQFVQHNRAVAVNHLNSIGQPLLPYIIHRHLIIGIRKLHRGDMALRKEVCKKYGRIPVRGADFQHSMDGPQG